MTITYQPPLTPGYNSISAIPGLGGSNLATTRSPFFTAANQFIPRNLHDVIRWARYITMQSPVSTEVIRKLATYPITDFVVDTEKPASKVKYEEIFKSFKLKSTLHDIGFDYHTMGNVFISIYFPIVRNLICPTCDSVFPAKKADFVKFTNFQFEGTCPKCDCKGIFKHKDVKSLSIPDMNLIKWDPLNISVNHNPITNEYDYYYKISNEVKRRVKQGDRLFVDSMPWAFIEAIRNNQDFKFDNNNFFHMKNMSTGQLLEGVSVPPLISHFGLVFYQASLRRANEAIAQDFMSPMRVVYPQPQTGNSDPVVALSMKNFQARMTEAFQKHKLDPSHVVVAPVPIGYEAVSGEGKALLITSELELAEETMLLSLGVSKELLTGTTNWTSSTVGLRMLENTLQTYTGQVNDLLDWVMDRVARYLGIEVCEVKLTPFKLTDDDNLREVLLKLSSEGKASASTLYESYGMDYDRELERIREDAVAEAVNQIKAQMEVERGQFMAAKEVAEKFDNNSEYKAALGKAQIIAAEIKAMDQGTQLQVMNQLQLEDYAMFLLVSRILDQASEADHAQAMQEAEVNAAGQPAEPQPGEENEKVPKKTDSAKNPPKPKTSKE